MRRFPAWMVGVVYLPFGLYNGVIAAGLPLLLTSRHVPLSIIGTITFVALIPSVFSFFITPVVDCMMPRRAWSALLAAVCALCLVMTMSLLDRAAASEASRHLLTAILALGCTAAQMYGSSIGGMVPNLVEERSLSAASMFLNIAYLGGTGVGATIAVFAVNKLPHAGAYAVLCAEMLLPPACLFLVHGEDRTVSKFIPMMRTLFHHLKLAFLQGRLGVGVMIFILPAATFVAMNYFGGMGAEFHASETMTSWITGTGVAVLTSCGAVVCAWLEPRFDTRKLVIVPGILSAIATLGMAFGPHTQQVFFAGVALYAFLAGVNYVAVTALAFEMIGSNNPLSATLYSLLMAVCNIAIEAVVLSDGRAARNGVHHLLLTDAAISVTCGIVLLTTLAILDHRSAKQVRRLA